MFEGLAEEFKRTSEDGAVEPTEAASNSLTQAVRNITLLSHDQQGEVFRKTVSAFDDEQQKTAQTFAQTVETALSPR